MKKLTHATLTLLIAAGLTSACDDEAASAPDGGADATQADAGTHDAGDRGDSGEDVLADTGTQDTDEADVGEDSSTADVEVDADSADAGGDAADVADAADAADAADTTDSGDFSDAADAADTQDADDATDSGDGTDADAGPTDPFPEGPEFFVSIDGNDTNDGLTEETALFTIQEGVQRCADLAETCGVVVLDETYLVNERDGGRILTAGPELVTILGVLPDAGTLLDIPAGFPNQHMLVLEGHALEVRNLTLDGGTHRCINAQDNVNLIIRGSDLQCDASSSVGSGSTVLIERSSFIDVVAQVGPAFFAINSDVTVRDSFFSGCSIDIAGGPRDGSALSVSRQENDNIVRIENTVFLDNVSTSLGGAVYIQGGQLEVDSSSFVGNAAAEGASQGGAIFTREADVTVRNTTFEQNSAGLGAALAVDWRDRFPGLVVINSTFSQNTCRQGPGCVIHADVEGFLGLYNVTIAESGVLGDAELTQSISEADELANSVIWETMIDVCAERPLSVTNSSVSDNSCGSADEVSENPLQSLADNGGPALWRGGTFSTHAITTASPAHDSGDPTGCADGFGGVLDRDQRGEPRPVGAACDRGAFELGE